VDDVDEGIEYRYAVDSIRNMGTGTSPLFEDEVEERGKGCGSKDVSERVSDSMGMTKGNVCIGQKINRGDGGTELVYQKAIPVYMPVADPSVKGHYALHQAFRNRMTEIRGKIRRLNSNSNWDIVKIEENHESVSILYKKVKHLTPILEDRNAKTGMGDAGVRQEGNLAGAATNGSSRRLRKLLEEITEFSTDD